MTCFLTKTLQAASHRACEPLPGYLFQDFGWLVVPLPPEPAFGVTAALLRASGSLNHCPRGELDSWEKETLFFLTNLVRFCQPVIFISWAFLLSLQIDGSCSVSWVG